MRVPVASPAISDRDIEAVVDVLKRGEISGSSPYIGSVEEQLAAVAGAPALLVSNGSVAIMLALRALEIGHGDEVIVPTFTYAATASSVVNVGAIPVFVDSSPSDWNMDFESFSQAISPRTKAVILVDLYGVTRDWSPIVTLARSRGLAVIHDCAESLGATYDGSPTGYLADVRTYSFFANKVITSGEGGAAATDDLALLERLRILRGQGMSLTHRYWFEEPGYNFRLSSIQAALLSGQLARLDETFEKRMKLFEAYDKATAGIGVRPIANALSGFSPWMYTIKLSDIMPHNLAEHLAVHGIETRPSFYLLHTMPAFSRFARHDEFPVAHELSAKSISLPTYSDLKGEELELVISALRSFQ